MVSGATPVNGPTAVFWMRLVISASIRVSRPPVGEVMTKIIAQVRQHGNSLVLVVTRVCAVMGIKNGDWVSIDMKKAKIIEKEDEEGKE